MSKQKTHAEIIAEMRRGTRLPGFWRSCDLNKILQYHADRLEAAHKRERGDCAKLREAIEDLFAKGCVSRHDRVAVCPPCIDNEGYSPSNEWCARCSSDVKEKCMAIYNACAALAAPPRNCDKYANYKDAMKAFEAFVRERGKLGFINPYTEAFKWLFAHATETEGGNDGRQ